MPQTPHTDQQHRAILESIAHRAMLERGLLPDFSAAVLAELGRIQAPADAKGESVGNPSVFRDLTDLQWASIDNDDSLDLDQLTVAEAMPGDKVKIRVAVADVDALVKDYRTREEAREGIQKAVGDFYLKNYPEVMKTRKSDVDAAAQAACDIYDHSVFPDMKVNWTSYAMNIGHRNWPGCFRCHDGNHVSEDGRVLSKECTTCHTMPQRGPLGPLGSAVPTSSENWHPLPLQGKHADLLCNRCHAAGFRPTMDCAGCHKLKADAPMMGDCTTCHSAPGVKLPLADCKTCHDTLGGLHKKGGHPDASCMDCHAKHVWTVTSREACLACHDDKKEHNAPTFCGD